MTNNNDEFDFDSLKGVLGVQKVANLWAKAEIAKILMKRATDIFEEINTELKFYSITHELEKE